MKKKQQKMKSWLKQWDSGEFEFSTADKRTKRRERPNIHEMDHSWANVELKEDVYREIHDFRVFYPFAMALLGLAMIVFLLSAVREMPRFGAADTPANTSQVIKRYISEGMEETGAVNVVAGVILDYRAFDTLGESHVLFTATIAVFILLLSDEEEKEKRRDRAILSTDLLLRMTTAILVPIIIMFGVYVILNGHLGPGGGFSGGAIIGSSLIMYSMSFGPESLQKLMDLKRYRVIVLCALSFYSLAKCYSFFCGANELHSIISPGTPGLILSGGLILPLNIAVGIVVACTMYGFYSIFTRGRI